MASSSQEPNQSTSSAPKTSPAPHHPPMICCVDNTATPHELYIPPGHWDHANSLLESEKYDELSKFSPWSDQPPLSPRECNQMSYTDGRNGVERNIHLPRGTMGRACELYAREDWEGLEGFEVWTGNVDQDPPEDKERMEAHARGVERMRIRREEAAVAERESKGQVTRS